MLSALFCFHRKSFYLAVLSVSRPHYNDKRMTVLSWRFCQMWYQRLLNKQSECNTFHFVFMSFLEHNVPFCFVQLCVAFPHAISLKTGCNAPKCQKFKGTKYLYMRCMIWGLKCVSLLEHRPFFPPPGETVVPPDCVCIICASASV